MQWTVIIEESLGFFRRSMSWRITHTRTFADLELARTAALEWARDYSPRHPVSPKGREVYQVGEDTWLVNIEGMVASFHFRVSLARAIT